MTTFAAFNDHAIWGVGATADEARENSFEWLDNKQPPEDIAELVASLDVLPMSEALAAIVAERGGDVAFVKRDGALIAYSEAVPDEDED